MPKDLPHQRLKKFREDRGMSTYEMGAAIGVSHVHVLHLENRRSGPGRDLSVRIQHFTGIPVEAWTLAYRKESP